MVQDQFLQRIKQSINDVCPDARIILFGSQARKTANENSDWDFLILLDTKKITTDIEKSIRHPLYRIEWETGQIISTLIKPAQQWENDAYKETELHKNIFNEGIEL